MTENNNHQTSNCNTENETPSKPKKKKKRRKDSAAAKTHQKQILCHQTSNRNIILFFYKTEQSKSMTNLFLFLCLRVIMWHSRIFFITFCIIFRNQTERSAPPTHCLFVHDIAWLKTMTHNDVYTVSKLLLIFFFFFYLLREITNDNAVRFALFKKSRRCGEFSPLEQSWNKVSFHILLCLLLVAVVKCLWLYSV